MNNANMFLQGQMWWIHGTYEFGTNWRILVLLLSRLSCFLFTRLFSVFLLHRTWFCRNKHIFSQPLRLNHLHPQKRSSHLTPPHAIFHWTNTNIASWRTGFLLSSPFRTRSAHLLKIRSPSRQRKYTHRIHLNYVTHVALTRSHPRLTNGVPWHIPSGLLLWDSQAWLFCMATTIFIRVVCFSLMPMQQA